MPNRSAILALPQMTDPLESVSVRVQFSCIECDRPWLVEQERWRLKVTDDRPPQMVAYCPECERREFSS
jgi:hypothetical protein